ncbi:cytochrome c [Roseospira marina]|uniref:Cytochrome c n=1 Tax=Roseospira marina TaxID=140057 RepID=A0A5M6I9R5_9PROT|nr:cytochrome c [Roseospira marina]KAA5604981.1 cytochrome c [Roseospira marina]MBB4315015.1 cytochrome c556 [Roseospira marina]MBB5088015.1 cytochrome c556 [Roseospira marina]
MTKGLTAAAALMMAAIAASPAMADDGEAAVQYRKDVMTVAGASMGALGCFMQGGCALEGPVLARAAKSIAFSGELAVDAFKVDTRESMAETDALPKVWEDWEAFEGGLTEMSRAADELAVAAADGDKAAMGPLMRTLGGTCKDCHDTFRD